MPFPRNQSSRPQLQRGVGLIEVLIAVLVMAIGLLGIAALQATALRNNSSAMQRSQAVIQTYAILDAMRANLPGVSAGAYNQAAKVCTNPTAGSGATQAERDLNTWLNGLQAAMGESSTTCGQVSCVVTATPNAPRLDCTVNVTWDDSRGTGGASVQTITTRSRLQ